MAKTVDDYLAKQPPAVRPILKRVRTVLRRALPKADEVISYGIPALRQHDRIVVYWSGWKKHLSLYPMTRAIEKALAKELEAYGLSHKGTVRFDYAQRLPVHLISTIARMRLAEVEAKRAAAKRVTKR